MNKPRSRLAVASLVLGLFGCWFVLLRAPFLLVMAIPLGIVTLLCGIAAAWKISRRNTAVRGRGMAIAGICLGAAASFFGMAALVGVIAQEIHPQRFQHHHDYHQHAQFSRSPMRDVPATNFTSNLPIVVLETDGQYVSKENRSFVRTRFYDAKSGRRASVSTEPDHAGFGTINLRGHSTLGLPKPSYTFHTTDARTNQTKVALLGLPAEEDWVLYAPFEDKSLIRDVLAYELARRMGHYAPRTRYVELFMKNNPSDDDDPLSMRDYMGVYVLVERIKRGKDRVNIAKLGEKDSDEPAISGGYIVKRDHGEGGGGRFRTARGGPYFYVYPKARDITSAQKSWIRDYFVAFEETLYSENFADPREGYAAYLEVNAFIDSHWLIELSKNVDGFRYSAYLTKDRGKKLKPGPAWDWNRAFGNANYYGGGQVRGWYWTVLRPNEICWHQRLRDDPAYVERAAKRWVELRKNVLDPKKVSALIDQYASELKEAQERNFERWPILGVHISSNHYVGDSHRDEVEWLKKWVERRIEWIDSQVEDREL